MITNLQLPHGALEGKENSRSSSRESETGGHG
jgi:hypothetical protein